ncbi:MAG: heat-inducible transcription repressor HrcA [Alphaproteobacteria bacterium]|nr:MAG: heat-inducible transcription repressor HrcA [Alphaproteobacteria bacterium]
MDLKNLNTRLLEIFNAIVETYMDGGEAVSSKSLAVKLENRLSPATIRNVMADLEDIGLIFSPHTSSGRLPTEKGLRLFVDSFIISQEDLYEQMLKEETVEKGKNFDDIINRTSEMLSTFSKCASLISVHKPEQTIIKHIEFLPLSEKKGLVIMVSEEGVVENRIINLPSNFSPAQLVQASNYINYHFSGAPLSKIKSTLMHTLGRCQSELDQLTQKIIQDGLAEWDKQEHSLIIKGQSRLLSNIQHMEDLAKIQNLFTELEAKEGLSSLVDASLNADGVKLFIGSEHELFDKTGCSMVLSPYRSSAGSVIGVVGVIGPVSMNYKRIIPMVDYSSKLIQKLIRGS